MRFIFDSSAIMNLIKSKRFEVFLEGGTTPLSKYECLNVIWKECKLYSKIKEDEALKLIDILRNVFEALDVVDVDDAKAMELALKEDMTYYDAIFLSAAIKEGATLVTDDTKLEKIAKKYVKSLRSEDL